jgi:hypothetical protein
VVVAAPAWGGAIFSQGAVTIDDSTLTGNTAQGGSSSVLSSGNGGGGIGTNAFATGGGFGEKGGAGGFGGGGGGGTSSLDGFGGGVGVGGANPAGGGGAGLGGAIFNLQGQLTITNSTLARNRAVAGADDVPVHAGAAGGAVFNLNGSVTAVDSTFALNIAANDGASIYNLGYDSAKSRTAEATLDNTIVARGTGPVDLTSNLPAQVMGALTNLSSAGIAAAQFDLIQTKAARAEGTLSGSPLRTDPLLGPLQANGGATETMAPAAGSPVIDAGSAFGNSTDQRGDLRPAEFSGVPNAAGGDGSDIGAFELQPSCSGEATILEACHALTVTATGAGVVSGEAIACPTICSASFGASVTESLTPKPVRASGSPAGAARAAAQARVPSRCRAIGPSARAS